jgi:predicted PurR-regulated permease PerM
MNDNNNSQYKIYEIIISVIALSLFGILFTSTQLFKSPFIVFGVIIFVLFPFRKSKLIKIILSLSVVIFLLWFFREISQLLVPFIIAFLISYILNPLVEILGKKNLSRTISSIIILLAFISVIVIASIFLIPVIVHQFTEFINNIPSTFTNIQNWVNVIFIPWLSSYGIPTQDLQSKIVSGLPDKMSEIFKAFIGGLAGVISTLSIILSQIINIILIPFLTFYILKDFDDIKSLVKNLLPQNKKNRIVKVFHKIDSLLGSYLRGALTVALINGILVSILLTLIGVKYSILLGAIAGLLDLIPYFGLLISLALSTIVALFSGNPGIQVPLTILTFIGLNLLETSFLAPKIIGSKIGLHPALLILSLLVFSYFFGFFGLIIALPTVSIMIMFFKEWMEKRTEKISE